MKKTLQILTIGLLMLVCNSAYTQSPQKFSFQTVIRNGSNQLLANQQVGIKISLLQGSETGIVVYSERHTPNTNSNGLATLSIGTGAVLSGNFQNINWSSGSYYIQTETDPNGGNSYTIISTQQLLSVPYALYAETSGSSTPGPQGEQGPIGQTGPQGPQGPQGEVGLTGPQGNTASDDQGLSVSEVGDTLFLQNGGFVIIPGISAANNSGGQTLITQHTCGVDSVHNPVKTYGSMTDQQANVYKTVVIGNQEWMAENLKTTLYRNGDPIINVTDNSQWGSLTTGAWCHYNNNSQYECPYGKLYNWFAVTDPRHICPSGWHEPTDGEWNVLITHLDPNGIGNDYFSSTIAGGKLKSRGYQYWFDPNQDATNESGFSGLPGGIRYGSSFSNFDTFGIYGSWWSSTEGNISNAYFRNLYSVQGLSAFGADSKQSGFSVRCLKD